MVSTGTGHRGGAADESLPSSVTRGASADRLLGWAQQTRHLHGLRTVLEPLALARIPVLPVKGILSGHTLYADVADRILTDVDLKIPPRYFRRLLNVGKQRGWRIVQRMHAYGNVVFVVEGIYFDIETFVSSPWLSRLTVDEMVSRAAPSHLLGCSHLLADFDDHAVLLILNIFKDKLVHAFSWAVKDVERLPANAAFDPHRLASRLREVGGGTIGWIVADWMVRERGVAGWAPVRNALGDRPGRALYVEMLARLREMQPRGALALRLLSRIAADHPTDRIRALGRMAWWQVEAWASRFGDAPLRRQEMTRVKGTIFSDSRKRD